MKKRYKLLFVLGLTFLSGFLIPEPKIIPVVGATQSDWNKDSFWYEPWGTSGVHKGIDIFSAKGTPVVASTNMLVLYKGKIPKGGNIVVALGPKWRLHYFAHLNSVELNLKYFLAAGSKIGTVGDTGNAKGKPPHLHFSIGSLIPLVLLIDSSTQGYKKSFYLNPIEYFND